jgi:hypothetical protein
LRLQSFCCIVFRSSSSVTFRYRCVVLEVRVTQQKLNRPKVQTARQPAAGGFVPQVVPVQIDLRKLLANDPSARPGPRASKDPDDDKYIAAAIEGRARFLVAGDSDLLDLKEYDGIRIVSPRVFLDLLA